MPRGVTAAGRVLPRELVALMALGGAGCHPQEHHDRRNIRGTLTILRLRRLAGCFLKNIPFFSDCLCLSIAGVRKVPTTGPSHNCQRGVLAHG